MQHHSPIETQTQAMTDILPEFDEQDVIDVLIGIDLRILTTDQYNSNSGTEGHNLRVEAALWWNSC